MQEIPVAPDIPPCHTGGMEVLMTILILTALCLAAGFWGADSRPLDVDRPTKWWPATPRS
jgi:hypothetical protein